MTLYKYDKSVYCYINIKKLEQPRTSDVNQQD